MPNNKPAIYYQQVVALRALLSQPETRARGNELLIASRRYACHARHIVMRTHIISDCGLIVVYYVYHSSCLVYRDASTDSKTRQEHFMKVIRALGNLQMSALTVAEELALRAALCKITCLT